MGSAANRRLAAAAGLSMSVVATTAVVYLGVYLLDARPPELAFLAVLMTMAVLTAGGLAAALGPMLWPGLSRRRAALEGLVAGGLCWIAGFPAFGFLFFYACLHRSTGPAWIAGALTYGLLATYLLSSPRRAWLWPLAAVAAAALAAGILQLTPTGSFAAFN